ncbi:hypothetical protein C4D60_Mb08t30890 [Musa balbisiana]|uniref:phosphoglucomutase (alpha-D-glucose-1,6-bisphosphate-dependent) n=1 Tax=Musa balbisiana TaxID=52838 RepID=A0A4S8K7U4_MUSBA|nr:hypothetical protein C4D60_Mb08t30890 [Musa balbisiana]
MENGGPAPEAITDKIYANTKTLKEYFIAEDLPDIDISVLSVSTFSGPEGPFDVDVFDSTTDYVKLMKSIFDFGSIQKLLSCPNYDALHGVAGIYAKHIFVEELGANESSLLNCTPKEDFGGGHPDPNLTYAKELVARMGLGKSSSQFEPPEFGAAADGDADRNMVLGKRFFVTPSDSVAIIAANAVEAIPYFASGLKGVARSIFDFGSIQKLLSCPNYDALHGVAGIYAKHIFVEELGANESSLLNCTPKEDFGGGHPDPNLTYAKELVARMGLGKSSSQFEPPEFGAAADGDADRNMVLGKDSVAIIAANAVEAIPYFASGLKGVARSMPTSAALDVVAKNLGLKFFEVPTGWKFFGNLMDAGLCSICGEESFGTGSDHIREKDGIWAVLAWLSILAFKNKDKLNDDKLVTVEDIVRKHWATYGRHYYTRYDYENVDAGAAKELMAHLVNLQSSLSEVNRIIKEIRSDVSDVVQADEFEYKDPVDGSVSKHQGIRYLFVDGSRLVFRLSGTGSEGATIRVYIEQYENDATKTGRDSQEALGPLVEVALKLSKMKEFTGRSAPTVIT